MKQREYKRDGENENEKIHVIYVLTLGVFSANGEADDNGIDLRF